MPRSREKLKTLVAASVDELIPAGDNVGGQTAIEAPTEIIEDELDLSAEYVLRTAPLPLLFPVIESDKKHFHGTSVEDVDTRVIIDTATKKVTIPCPDNFLRFVSLRLSGWARDVKEIMDPRAADYRRQEYNNYTGGSSQKPKGALVSFSDYLGGAAGTSETIKWDIDATATQNVTLTEIFNGESPTGLGSVSTGDVVSLPEQTDGDENGIYLVNASGAPTLLTDKFTSNTGVNKFSAIECYRAASTSDTISHFHYIPEKVAEEMPDSLVDAMVWHCAGRVLHYMQRLEQSNMAMEKADKLLGTFKLGLIGE